jgi:hypothetical protein
MTLGQPPGTLSQYVNLQALKTLQASVTATATTTHRADPGRRRTGRHRDDHQHFGRTDGRLLPARGRAQGHRGRN